VGNVGNRKQIAHIAHKSMCSHAIGSPHGASRARAGVGNGRLPTPPATPRSAPRLG
jgi:hypothetical protein